MLVFIEIIYMRHLQKDKGDENESMLKILVCSISLVVASIILLILYLYFKHHQKKFQEQHLHSAEKRLLTAIQNIEHDMAQDQIIKKQNERIQTEK